MQLSRLARPLLAAAFGAALSAAASAAYAQAPPDGVLDADFLFGYYDQDGDRSPVTGGVGTEKLHVYSPVLQLAWRASESFTLSADVGIDQVSSASMGYTLDHTAGVFLIDGEGRLRGLSPYGQPVADLAADLATLAREALPARHHP